MTTEYQCWVNINKRCSEEYQKRFPTYIGCKNNFKNRESFKKWFNKNYVKGWHLDKDLLGDGKSYSSETCCFLPSEINSLIIKKRRNNTSGFNGVCWNKQKQKWQAQIRIGRNNRKHLGLFDSKEKAYNAYLIYKRTRAFYLCEIYYLETRIAKRVLEVIE